MMRMKKFVDYYGFSMSKTDRLAAFTLAEMMVVMLILSIVMAAFAPVMTTRSKVDLSSPWKYAPNNSDIYYGLGNRQTAMIGQRSMTEDDPLTRLLIRTVADDQYHIAFKKGNDNLGVLGLSDSTIVLGDGKLTGTGNVVIGKGGFTKNTTGQNNIAIGPNVLVNNTSGSSNTIIGDNAMGSNTTGTNNTGIGTTLASNTTGSRNTSIGDDSLTKNTTGSDNTAIGYHALQIATASENTAVGVSAMSGTYTGTRNVGVGFNALSKTNSNDNVAIGYKALENDSLGSSIVAIGSNAAYSSLNGGGNVAIGSSALYSNTNSAGNTAVGQAALYYTTGNNNLGVGNRALHGNKTGNNNIAVGNRALSNYTETSDNTAVGHDSMGHTKKGSGNVAVGGQAMNYMSGSSNTAVGYQALYGNGYDYGTDDNTAIGYQALYKTNYGQRNVAIGVQALYNNTNGYNNIAIGNDWNVGPGTLGSAMLSNTTGSNNIALGGTALYNNTTGYDNVGIGYHAVYNNQTGSYNTGVGYNACSNATGSYKTCIGYNSNPKSGSEWARDDKERIFIGSKSKFNGGAAVLEVHNDGGSWGVGSNSDSTVVINGNLVVKGGVVSTLWKKGGGDNDDINLYGRTGGQLEPFGANGVISKYGTTERGYFKAFSGRYFNTSGWGWTSDKRLKFVGSENKSGLDKIKELKVFNFTFKNDPKKTPQVGVMAQDLQKVFPNAVKKGEDGYLTIRWDDMFYAVINAVKELDSRVTKLLKNDIDKEARIEVLEKQNKLLLEQNKKLEERLNKIEKSLNK